MATNKARQIYKNISMLFLFPVTRDLLFRQQPGMRNVSYGPTVVSQLVVYSFVF